MTKLYHYITKGNNALKQGILSLPTILKPIYITITNARAAKQPTPELLNGWKIVLKAAAAPFAVFRADTVDREKHKYVQTFYCEL